MAAVALALLSSACSHIPGLSKAATSPSASSTASAGGSPLAKATGQLDAQVAMPAGFPTDVPVYPGARLTAGAPFASTGLTAWGMEWETTDSTAKVQAFYQKELSQGDWSLTLPGSASPSPSPTPTNSTQTFKAVFARKSNPHDSGTIAINADSGVTMIDLSLVSSP